MITTFKDYYESTATKKDMARQLTTTLLQQPTGFIYLDYTNGTISTVCDENDNQLYCYHNVGIPQGSVNVIISKSQGGKTSLMIKVAATIIEPWINDPVRSRYFNPELNPKVDLSTICPLIQIIDTEKTLGLDYVKKIARFRNKELQKYVAIDAINTDVELMSLLEKHIKFKVDTMQKINMPMNDIFGTPIKNYPPSVMIIDSMSQLILSDVAEVDVDVYMKQINNTAGARRARIISALYSKLVNCARQYNITIFSINHINKMPAMNGIPVKQYRGLRGGETIGGGERAIYLAANILRLDVIKSIGGESSSSLDFGEGVKGFITSAHWIKSKCNSKGNTCQLVYTDGEAYSPLLSMVWNAMETGHLQKSGNFYYVDGFPNLKLSRKNTLEVFADNPILFNAIYDQIRDKCAGYLDNPENARTADKKFMKELHDDMKGEVQSGNYSHNDASEIESIFAEMVNS